MNYIYELICSDIRISDGIHAFITINNRIIQMNNECYNKYSNFLIYLHKLNYK